MKRSPMPRGTSQLERHTPLPKVNRKRKARLFAEQFDSPAFVKWVRMQECVVPRCGGWPCEAAHVVSRGAGGTSEDIVSLCPRHHRLQHDTGVETFQAEYGVDLEALAAETQARWTTYQQSHA